MKHPTSAKKQSLELIKSMSGGKKSRSRIFTLPAPPPRRRILLWCACFSLLFCWASSSACSIDGWGESSNTYSWVKGYFFSVNQLTHHRGWLRLCGSIGRLETHCCVCYLYADNVKWSLNPSHSQSIYRPSFRRYSLLVVTSDVLNWFNNILWRNRSPQLHAAPIDFHDWLKISSCVLLFFLALTNIRHTKIPRILEISLNLTTN